MGVPPIHDRLGHSVFCRQCDYSLYGLSENRCPECGTAFDPADASTVSKYSNGSAKRRRRKNLRRFLLFSPLLAYVILTITIPSGFACREYCTKCGLTRGRDERQLPFLPITYHVSESQTATGFSASLTRHGIRSGHTHEWSLISGNDDGVQKSCALGAGRHAAKCLNSPDAIVFTDAICLYTEPQTRDRLLDQMLDSIYGPELLFEIQTAGLPMNGFQNSDGFLAWWTNHQSAIEAIAKKTSRE